MSYLRACFGIAENRVGVVKLTEPSGVAGLAVVGMKPLGQQPVHAVNHVRIGVRADLQRFVVVSGYRCPAL